MLHLIVSLHLLGLRLQNQLEDRHQGRDRGSLTIEQVAWAAAIIGIVAIAVAGIKVYVNSQLGKL